MLSGTITGVLLVYSISSLAFTWFSFDPMLDAVLVSAISDCCGAISVYTVSSDYG